MALADTLSSKPATLIVQSGGMRGTYPMAACAALESEGFTDAFSHAYGSSSGAPTVTFFLAGQAQHSVKVYTNMLSGRRFINYRRFWRIMDIDYMVDSLFRNGPYALDTDALEQSDTELNIALTNAKTGRLEYRTSADDVDILELIRATTAIPVLYGRTVRIGKKEYIDGGIADPLPLATAINDGRRNIIVISTTKQLDYCRPKNELRMYRMIRKFWYSMSDRDIVHMMRDKVARYNRSVAILRGDAPVPENVTVHLVSPSDPDLLVTRTTRDRKRLRACAKMGYRDMKQALFST